MAWKTWNDCSFLSFWHSTKNEVFFSKCDQIWRNTEEILNWKLLFLCSVNTDFVDEQAWKIQSIIMSYIEPVESLADFSISALLDHR